MISRLTTWRIDKDTFFTTFYQNTYYQILDQTKSNYSVIEAECNGLIDTLIDMKETLSKFNTDSQKEKVAYSQVKKEKEKDLVFN